jgi:pimeloyl-ACP methyl ester carboxylesterase
LYAAVHAADRRLLVNASAVLLNDVMLTVTERMVDAAGTAIFVRESGQGPPVVLLHGFPETGRCWQAVARALSENHRVLVPDLPGYGRSARPTSYDSTTLANTIASFMEAAGAPRAAVVGHDWGGGVAFRLALTHPDQVKRLAVINSPFRKLDLRHGWHMLFFNLPLLPEALLTAAGDRWIDFILRAASTAPDAFEPDALAEYHRAYRTLERKRSAFAYYRTVTRRIIASKLPTSRLPARARSSGPRGSIDMPTLVIWGALDRALPIALAEGIVKEIPHARLETIPDAGHFVPEERPERVAQLLKEFLA